MYRIPKHKKASSRFYTFVLLLLVFINYTMCGDKDRSPRVYDIEKHLKEWMFFDTGTWWVYKEFNSGNLDSQYVTYSEIITFDSKPKDKNTPYVVTESAKITINSGFLFVLNSTFGGSTIEKKVSGVRTYFYYKPLQVGSRKGQTGLGYTEIIHIDPDYTLAGSKNDTMITLLENYDLTEDGDPVEYKIFKGVGIISKKNISKKQDWQLMKYHIRMNRN